MTITRTFVRLALVVAFATTGCTFRPFVELHDPGRVAEAPCFSGDVCAIGRDGAGFAWIADVFGPTQR